MAPSWSVIPKAVTLLDKAWAGDQLRCSCRWNAAHGRPIGFALIPLAMVGDNEADLFCLYTPAGAICAPRATDINLDYYLVDPEVDVPNTANLNPLIWPPGAAYAQVVMLVRSAFGIQFDNVLKAALPVLPPGHQDVCEGIAKWLRDFRVNPDFVQGR